MEFVDFFERENAQQQVDKLAKKYKNKKVVLYGAGMYSRIFLKNYDVSKLPVIGIVDRKFSYEEISEHNGFKTIKLEELKELDMDVIISLVQETDRIVKYLRTEILNGTKNVKVKIIPIVQKTFLNKIKELLED